MQPAIDFVTARNGTAVVEELKDAIWRVGERRRRLVEGRDVPTAPPARGPRQILAQQWDEDGAPVVEPTSPAL